MGDKYEHPTQIPAAYPSLENEALLEEWLEEGKSPSSPRDIRKKEMVEPVEDEARKKEALDKGEQVPNDLSKPSNGYSCTGTLFSFFLTVKALSLFMTLGYIYI